MTCPKEKYDKILSELDPSTFYLYVATLKPDERVLVQMKCLEMFKWERNQEFEEELDMEALAIKWAEEGYAKAFKEAFDKFMVEDLCICQVYEETIRIQATY